MTLNIQDIKNVIDCHTNPRQECVCLNALQAEPGETDINFLCWKPECYLPGIVTTERLKADLGRCRQVVCSINVHTLKLNPGKKGIIINQCGQGFIHNSILNYEDLETLQRPLFFPLLVKRGLFLEKGKYLTLNFLVMVGILLLFGLFSIL